MAIRHILRVPSLPVPPKTVDLLLSWISQDLYPALLQAFDEHLHTFPGVISGELRTKQYTEATKPTAAQAGIGAVIISTDAATKPQMSDGSSWLGLGAGAGGGDNITIKTVAVTDADFNDTTPAAPGAAINVKWQRSGSGPDSVSAYVDAATTAAKGVVELATDGEIAANVVVQGNDSRLALASSWTRHFMLMGA